jgi:hypothetical protein
MDSINARPDFGEDIKRALRQEAKSSFCSRVETREYPTNSMMFVPCLCLDVIVTSVQYVLD